MKSFYSHALKTFLVAVMAGMGSATASGTTGSELSSDAAFTCPWEGGSHVCPTDPPNYCEGHFNVSKAQRLVENGKFQLAADHFQWAKTLLNNPEEPLYQEAEQRLQKLKVIDTDNPWMYQ